MSLDHSIKVIHKIRVSQQDAHYAGNLVDGAKLLQFFGDVATEILIRLDGDEGLFRSYKSVDFFQPVCSGDFLEISGELIRVGTTSREIQFHIYKYIQPLSVSDSDYKGVSSAVVLEEPRLVCSALGVCVVPKNLQKVRSC